MLNIIALRVLAYVVLVPTTLAAGFWAFMALGFMSGAMRDGVHMIAAAILLFAMVVGWFGIITLWRLYYGFLRGFCAVATILTGPLSGLGCVWVALYPLALCSLWLERQCFALSFL